MGSVLKKNTATAALLFSDLSVASLIDNMPAVMLAKPP